MKKVYTVELVTEQKECESFWMYRGFGYDKDAAEECAALLSTFFPYYEYPTKIILFEEDEFSDGSLHNKIVLKEYHLKNEDGKIV